MPFKIGVEVADEGAPPMGATLNGGDLRIRSGEPPANVAAADQGTLLGTPTFSATAFGAPSSGAITAASITSGTAVASADAGHFRARTSGGANRMQGTAGEAGDSPDMVFDNKTIVTGGTIAISSFVLTMPLE